MEQSKLMEIASKNETSKRVFEALYGRKRNTQYTQLGSMRNEIKRKTGFQVAMTDFNQCFTALEHEGVGKTEYGERGTLKGFYWLDKENKRVEPREVGRLGLGIQEAPKPIPAPVVAPTGLTRGPITVIILRPGKKPKTLNVPDNVEPSDIPAFIAANA